MSNCLTQKKLEELEKYLLQELYDKNDLLKIMPFSLNGVWFDVYLLLKGLNELQKDQRETNGEFVNSRLAMLRKVTRKGVELQQTDVFSEFKKKGLMNRTLYFNFPYISDYLNYLERFVESVNASNLISDDREEEKKPRLNILETKKVLEEKEVKESSEQVSPEVSPEQVSPEVVPDYWTLYKKSSTVWDESKYVYGVDRTVPPVYQLDEKEVDPPKKYSPSVYINQENNQKYYNYEELVNNYHNLHNDFKNSEYRVLKSNMEEECSGFGLQFHDIDHSEAIEKSPIWNSFGRFKRVFKERPEHMHFVPEFVFQRLFVEDKNDGQTYINLDIYNTLIKCIYENRTQQNIQESIDYVRNLNSSPFIKFNTFSFEIRHKLPEDSLIDCNYIRTWWERLLRLENKKIRKMQIEK